MEANCQEFRKNAELINKNIEDKEYFDYLEVRERYRLSRQKHPYSLAIKALR